MEKEAKEVRIIAGPTASGKSALALEIAQRENGIVINADSMQVYDALPVLTARPSAEEQAAAPHALYAVLSAEKRCSAALWRDMALAEIGKAHAAGQLPIITGGTGFYIRALTEGLSPIPDVPAEFRTRATERLLALGNAAFHGELAALDPVMAARIGPGDTQRLIRAREVLDATGKSLSWWQSLPPETAPGLTFFVTLMMPARAALYERCDRRFENMLRSGALEETEALSRQMDAGAVPEDAPITHALGFRPLREHVRGNLPLDKAMELARTETRQYAKRQVTWFRGQVRPSGSVSSVEEIK